MSHSLSILLVGEGNFSFSAATGRSHSTSETSITATCLQQEEEALRQEGASNNIQIIRDSGKDCEYVQMVLSFTFVVFDGSSLLCVIQVERCFSGWTVQRLGSVAPCRAVCLTVLCLTFLTAGERVESKRTGNFSKTSSSGMPSSLH